MTPAPDPATPVVVGVAQVTRRPDAYDDVREAAEPVDLMADAVRLAGDDAGVGSRLVERIEATYVPQPLSRRYPDPGALVNRRLGIDGARSLRALVGGNSPQLMVTEAAAAIGRGELDVAVVTGAEAMHSRFRARREGVDLPWERSELPECREVLGDARPGTSAYEEAHGATMPIEIYPLFETAVRAAHGRDVAGHQEAAGRLWARFSEVAATNPHAWTRERYSPTEVVEPSPGNRVVTFPYTKRMCANMTVDQAAAVVLTGFGTARALGVPDDRIVFPLAGADAHDHFLVTERWSLADSPGIRSAARAALGALDLHVDDVAHLDLYSCFPSAVQVAAASLGIDASDSRPLTLTGGLAFFGGPGNDYVTHSVAEAVAACREAPRSVAMVTGVGWYLTKHSVGLYSTTPPPEGFVRVDPAAIQAEVDALPRRRPAGEVDGEATVEATAVVHDRGGAAERALVTLLTDDGDRALAASHDPGVLASMVEEPWEGRRVTLKPADGVNRLVT